ncbi:MAG TPA: hypothetical protein VFL38_06160, partial [Humibacillus xanthopallidus]|nr:hypothetical protein [Humibacillus xanthopallidus]
DRIVLVADGRVVADGPTAEIRSRASGRTVTAVVADDAVATATAALLGLPGVTDVRRRGERLVITASDSDAVARLLLGELGGRDLEITTAGLEEAFMALTGRSPAQPSPESPPDGIPARRHGVPEEVAR